MCCSNSNNFWGFWGRGDSEERLLGRRLMRAKVEVAACRGWSSDKWFRMNYWPFYPGIYLFRRPREGINSYHNPEQEAIHQHHKERRITLQKPLTCTGLAMTADDNDGDENTRAINSVINYIALRTTTLRGNRYNSFHWAILNEHSIWDSAK